MIESARTLALLRELRRGPRMKPAELARLRGRLLGEAVRHAFDRIPLYRDLWHRAGFDPSEVRGLEDLKAVPILTGKEARAAARRGTLLTDGVDRADLPAYSSGGSGGEPLEVPRGRVEQRVWRAGALRIWLEHGYRWRERTAHLDSQAGPPHPLQRLGISRSVWIDSESVDEQLAALAAVAAEVVSGTPTVLRRIARASEEASEALPRPRLVFCQGELLDAASRRLIERAFGVAPIDLYGATEIGFLAWQCERRAALHENAELVVVELLREGRPVGPGELGSVVVTDLRGRTVPMIRWETGDLARAASEPCPCGRALPTIASIEGRAADSLRGPSGEVSPRALVDRLAPLLAPDRYRLVRDRGSGPTLLLDPAAEVAPSAVAESVEPLLGPVRARVSERPLEGAGHKTRPIVAPAASPEPA